MILKLRKTDYSFRIGGDEFAVLLVNSESMKASKIINRIRLKWIQTFRIEHEIFEIPLGFSSGIAEYPKNAETQDSLIFLADTALYYSKKRGGDRHTIVSELSLLSNGDSLSNAILEQVYAMTETVDAKESLGFGHFKRVADIAEKIGKEMGLSLKEIRELHAASLLHDIGKIGISSKILSKPEALTVQEREIVKKHSSEGAKIVSQIGQIENLAPIIRHHHEWYDGNGYPDNLKGEQIPLGSRIICVADAFDSIVTQRSYHKALSHNDAITELEKCSGTQFDPAVVRTIKTILSK